MALRERPAPAAPPVGRWADVHIGMRMPAALVECLDREAARRNAAAARGHTTTRSELLREAVQRVFGPPPAQPAGGGDR